MGRGGGQRVGVYVIKREREIEIEGREGGRERERGKWLCVFA